MNDKREDPVIKKKIFYSGKALIIVIEIERTCCLLFANYFELQDIHRNANVCCVFSTIDSLIVNDVSHVKQWTVNNDLVVTHY